MISIIDTTPLVGLVDLSDQHHARAMAEIDEVTAGPTRIIVVPAVIQEALFHLRYPHLRDRLRRWLRQPIVTVTPIVEDSGIESCFAWLDRYARHTPDWADACIVIASGMVPAAAVWTFDREFATIWRRLDGSRIPLAVR